MGGRAPYKKGADAPIWLNRLFGSGILDDDLVRSTEGHPNFEIGVVSSLAVLIGAAALIGTCAGHPDVLARRDVTRLRIRRHIEPASTGLSVGFFFWGGGAAVGFGVVLFFGVVL